MIGPHASPYDSPHYNQQASSKYSPKDRPHDKFHKITLPYSLPEEFYDWPDVKPNDSPQRLAVPMTDQLTCNMKDHITDLSTCPMAGYMTSPSKRSLSGFIICHMTGRDSSLSPQAPERCDISHERLLISHTLYA